MGTLEDPTNIPENNGLDQWIRITKGPYLHPKRLLSLNIIDVLKKDRSMVDVLKRIEVWSYLQ